MRPPRHEDSACGYAAVFVERELTAADLEDPLAGRNDEKVAGEKATGHSTKASKAFLEELGEATPVRETPAKAKA